jgi:exodeoxyribonuclease I
VVFDYRARRTMAATNTFYWHDYETFGRVPRSDRPAQFAGIRTDLDLQEIEAPLVLYCQPQDDTLPDPEACLITGITPQLAQRQGVVEVEFAERILQKLAAPGTVGVGYNSLRFDDEVTRFLLWRNLLEPYGREWQNDCGRWDLLNVVRCCHALRPQALQWPTHDDGRLSLKLTDLTRVNGIEHADAHDALADVRATIELARRIKTQVPKLWDFALKLRRKQAVIDEVSSAQHRGEPLIHVSTVYGPAHGYLGLIWPLAPHPVNKNELIVWDLAQDPSVLKTLSSADVADAIKTKRLPIRTLALNRSPMVVSHLKTLDAKRALELGVDMEQAKRHAQIAANDVPMLAGLWPEAFAATPRAPQDVDEDLYGGFINDADRRRLQQVRIRPAADWAKALPNFEDERLEELVFRFKARNHPQSLDEDEQERWAMHRVARLVDGEGGARALEPYMEQLDALRAACTEPPKLQILDDLRDWALKIAP